MANDDIMLTHNGKRKRETTISTDAITNYIDAYIRATIKATRLAERLKNTGKWTEND